ncbi:MAG TPA: response regulator [Vicinamibacterales bacterium]|nr:response regulator [Vicinamibacterales bacterium]
MKPVRILNVEDYAPSRYVRSRLLREAGFEVAEATSAATALRVLHDQPVSLVVLDMNLPDGTGAELCRQIRTDAALATLPVLIISATARGELDRLEGVRSGANVYLTEPVPPAVLLSTIGQLLVGH